MPAIWDVSLRGSTFPAIDDSCLQVFKMVLLDVEASVLLHFLLFKGRSFSCLINFVTSRWMTDNNASAESDEPLQAAET